MKQNLSEWGSFYWVVPAVIASILMVWFVEKKRYKKPALWTMLGIWFVALTYLMFLYRMPGRQKGLVLDIFHMFREVIRYKGSITTNQALRQILFNVLLYVPFGVILGALSKRAWMPIMAGIILSIFTEMLQYLSALGIADIDDVVSNTFGVLIGTLVYRMLLRQRTIKPSNHTE